MISLLAAFLLCIDICLFFELLSIWIDDIVMAISFRSVIIFFLLTSYFFRNKKKFLNEFNYLLCIVLIQDLFISILTRRLFTVYTCIFVYLPILLTVCIYCHINRIAVSATINDCIYNTLLICFIDTTNMDNQSPNDKGNEPVMNNNDRNNGVKSSDSYNNDHVYVTLSD